MIFYSIIVFLSAFSCVTLLRAWHNVRAIEDSTLLDSDREGCSQSLGFIGCSVVCSGIADREQIADLLRQEYERYEVIVVLDSSFQAEALHEIVSHYRMVSVNCTPTLELPTSIRHLYRSRQRSYRRLIVVDTPHCSTYNDWNAGILVSSFDYILPISDGMALYNRAIENLAIALCSSSQIDLLRSNTSPATVVSRRTIIAFGGFSSGTARQLSRKAIVKTDAPIIYHSRHTKKIFSPRMAIITLVVTLLIVTSATQDLLFVTSILLTIGMLVSAARWVAVVSQPRKCSVRDILYHFKRIVDIFPSRKFMV